MRRGDKGDSKSGEGKERKRKRRRKAGEIKKGRRYEGENK